MKDIDLSTKKKIIILASIGLGCWGIVAWLFITRPLFMLDILPDFIPTAMFTFWVFLIGLLFLTLVGTLTVRAIAPHYAWLMICASAPLIVGFNHTSQPFFYSEPPTMLSVFQSCSVTGNNGWCKGVASLQLAASDPQGYTLTISGMIGDIPFTCPVGPTCGVPLPEGSGTITYKVQASTSGLSSPTGTTTWKRDVTPPTVTPLISSPNGLDGWHIEMSSVPVSMTALDLVSGVSPTNGMEMSYDAGPWKTGNLSVSEEGVHLIKFRATDNAGNVTPYEVRNVKLDKQGPAITFDVSGALYNEEWYISLPTTTISLDDPASGVDRFEWRYNGGAYGEYWEYGENWQENLIQSDGYHWLEVRAWDLAGNMSTHDITIAVDTTRPDFYPSYPTPNSQGWIVTAASVSVSGDDPGAGHYGSGLASALVSVNGGEWQHSAVLPDGESTVVFRVEDMAGNSRTMTRNFKVDRTAPDLSFSTSGTPGNPGWYLSQVETSVVYDDDTSGIDRVEYRQNGSSWQNTGTILSMDGINTIEARVYDLAGNVTNETLTVKVDTSAPSLDPIIPAVNGLNGWIVGPSVSVSANSLDSGSGLASALVSVNGGEWQNIAVLPDGESTVVFRVEDMAGNIATTSRTLKIDTTAPDLSFSTSGTPGNPGWYLSQVETSILYYDDTSGIDHVEYRQNGSSWQITGTLLSIDGVNAIEARVYDLAGNVANETLTIKVDTESPSLTLSKSGTLGNSSWYVSNVTTTIEASDQTSGVDIVQYNSNNTTWNTGSTITSTDGVNNIDIEAYDAAGNMATRFTQIKVDTVAPVVDPVVPTPDGLNDWFVTAPVAISVNGSDDLSGLESATVSTDTETLQENLDLSDGSHTVRFRSTDVAGNTTTVTRDVKVDTVAPLISASKSGTLGNSGWYISQVKTYILPTDNTSGIDSIQYNQNETGWNTGSLVTSDQGINSIDIVVYDVAGNRSTDSVQVKVDTVAPAVNPVIPSPNGLNGWFKTAPVDISVWGFDALSGLESASMSTDTEMWEDTAAISDGVTTVSFRSVDVAGNITIVTREVKVDTMAPSISASMVGIQGNSGWYTSQVTTNIVAGDDISGLDRIQYAQNGSGWTIGSSIVSGDGIHNIYVSAYDAAGNVVDHYIEVKVDTVAPTVNPIVPPPNGLDDWFVTGPVPVSAIGSDAISGLSGTQVSVNGGEWQDNDSVSDGANVVKFRSTDTAGNTTTVTREVKVDTIAPTLSFSRTGTAGKSDWFISQVTTEIEGSDGASGIDRIQSNQNNTGWQDGSSVNSSDGINTIEVNIYDAAGNKTTGSTQVKVDTIAPSFTVSKTGTAGKSDWYVSPVTLDIVSDDGGSGLESIQHNQNNTGWQDGSSFVSKDGVNSIDVQVSDAAGNVYRETFRVKVDTVPPSFASSNSGTDGASGWYISQTTTNILPEDNTSGIDHVEYSQNGGNWQTGTRVKSQDGINAIDVKIYDLAGNLATGQLQVKVDTGRPTSSFISPVNGSQNNLASGVFSMSGSSSDALSGIKVAELSYDGGKTWIPLVLSSNQWSYDFDTTVIPNGTYNVVVRAFDLAGNTDVAAIPDAHISLNISNGEIVSNDSPPHIKLTTEWFIWESGSLSIQADSSSLKNGRVVISDPQNRWPKVEMSFEDKYPSTITWDRRFANGILAPSGNYKVTVYACNLSDSCAEKSATIKIPVISILLPPPESTPVPEFVSPEQQTVTTEASVQPNIPVGTAEASSVGVVAPEPPSTESQVEPHPTSARTPPYIRFGGECLIFLMLICLVVAILRRRKSCNTQLN